MTRDQKDKALELTAQILHEYWHRKPELFLSHLHKNIFWIGSMDSEYIHGADNIRERINQNSNAMVDVCLKDEEYEALQYKGNTCLIVGRYTAYIKPETGQLLSEKQRVTFEWVLEDNKLQILHLHLSNILHIQKENEKFPTIAGKATFEYVKGILQHQNCYCKISVRDTDGTIMFLPDCEIVTINSNKNNIEIHCMNRTIVCHKTLKAIQEELPDNFIQIGRRCLINTDNVIEIKKDKIIMESQIEVPLLAKNITETIQRIKNNLYCGKTQ